MSIKRDQYQWKETYINEKRPISMKSDLYQSKIYINDLRRGIETHFRTCVKRLRRGTRDVSSHNKPIQKTFINEKRPTDFKGEQQKRPTRETHFQTCVKCLWRTSQYGVVSGSLLIDIRLIQWVGLFWKRPTHWTLRRTSQYGLFCKRAL